MSNRNEWTSPRRLYLDAGGEVVEANDRRRVSLLVGAGGSILQSLAVKLGLVGEPVAEVVSVKQPEVEVEVEPEVEVAVEVVVEKAKAVAHDKMRRIGQDKG